VVGDMLASCSIEYYGYARVGNWLSRLAIS